MATSSNSRLRIYGPEDNLGMGDDELSADQELDSRIGKELRAKIHTCYGRVKHLKGVLDAGFCFGLLDPVSNIIAGIAISKCVVLPKQEEEEEVRIPDQIGDMNQRSRDGLVAFLVALFPYLIDYRAMWYLIPLLLQQQTLPSVVLSLDKSWELASRRLLKLNLSLGEMNSSTLRRMLLTAIELASGRLLKLNPPEMPPVSRPAMMHMLLTTIHGYYLQALAWLPKDELRSHYHHSLLQAGHCYGPLDPVSNIILNTLWYSQASPLMLERKVEIEAISTKGLLRIAVRSLHGLVSFLCTRYRTLTPGEAMRLLQLALANLQNADDLNHTAKSKCDDGAIMVSVEEAYVAAAKAAHHPKPHQQAEFLGPSKPMLSAFSQVLQLEDRAKNHQLYLYYFRALGTRSKPAEETKYTDVLGPWDYSYVVGLVDDFWNQHNRAVRMVKSAIDMYSQQHGVPKYELHVICGVNASVGGPVHVTPFERRYRYSHINFLATQTAGAPPMLFFAECCNDGSGVGLCCPVAMPLPEQVRCLYCEVTGSRIVHPAKETFLGRDREFEKMLAGEEAYSAWHTNDDIISCRHKETLWVDYLEKDQVYGDYICGNNKVEEKFPMDDMY